MRAKLHKGAGDKRLCTVTFELDPDDPDTIIVDCVYEYHRPAEDNYQIKGDPCFLELRSITRNDTHEAVTLTSEQMEQVTYAVTNEVAREYGAL